MVASLDDEPQLDAVGFSPGSLAMEAVVYVSPVRGIVLICVEDPDVVAVDTDPDNYSRYPSGSASNCCRSSYKLAFLHGC